MDDFKTSLRADFEYGRCFRMESFNIGLPKNAVWFGIEVQIIFELISILDRKSIIGFQASLATDARLFEQQKRTFIGPTLNGWTSSTANSSEIILKMRTAESSLDQRSLSRPSTRPSLMEWPGRSEILKNLPNIRKAFDFQIRNGRFWTPRT